MAHGHTYTVRQGDTLSGIAAEQLGDADRWPEIFALNRDVIDDPDMIRPGQQLRLPDEDPTGPPPRVYTVRRGDTLSSIAKKHLGDANRWPEIFELNQEVISDPDEIFPGQVLLIPN
jgi:nucleoid-associated protein YgaU